jgi:hypothetical protein
MTGKLLSLSCLGFMCGVLQAQLNGFVYVANNGSHSVSAYTIDGTTGALTPVPGSPCGVPTDPSNCFPAGFGPQSVTVDPNSSM